MKLSLKMMLIPLLLGSLLLQVACFGGPTADQLVDGEFGPITGPQPTSVYAYWERQVGFEVSRKSRVDQQVAEVEFERDALRLEYEQASEAHEGEVAALLATGNESFAESSAIQEDAEAGLRAEAERVNASAEALREQSDRQDSRTAGLTAENSLNGDRLYRRGAAAEQVAVDVAGRLQRAVELALPRIRVAEQEQVRSRYTTLGRSQIDSQQKLVRLGDAAQGLEGEAQRLAGAVNGMEALRDVTQQQLHEVQELNRLCPQSWHQFREELRSIEESARSQWNSRMSPGLLNRLDAALGQVSEKCRLRGSSPSASGPVSLGAVSPVATAPVRGGDSPPHVFIGVASVDGQPVSVGTPVTAWDGSVKLGSVLVGADGAFTLQVSRTNGPVSFRVGSWMVNQAPLRWASGEVVTGFSLSVTTS